MNSRNGRLGNVVVILAALAFLALPELVQAQYQCTTNAGKITITGYTGPGGAVIIPGTITDLPVVSIGDSAFRSCSSLTSVTIPSSVTNIGPYPRLILSESGHERQWLISGGQETQWGRRFSQPQK